MMKRKSIYTICAAAALACSGMTATAQALQSGYFMEGLYIPSSDEPGVCRRT